MLLRRVLRRRLVRASIETEVLRRVLRRGGVIEGASNRRQKHALSQSTTPFACTLSKSGQPWDNPPVNQREKFIFPVFRGKHINFLVRLTLGQPAVCPKAIWTLTRA